MFNDTISDVLTRIRNANLIKSEKVSIPFTKMSHQICQILKKQGYIKSFQIEQIEPSQINLESSQIKSFQQVSLNLKYKGRNKKPCITNLRRISKPGLRIYANYKEIPKILGGMGIIIMSTSQGVMTGQEAQSRQIGGELMCSIW